MSQAIHNPTLASVDEHSATSASFVIEPLHTGYGMTLGNSLRRVLLSSVQGAAITSFRIEGATHEFTTIPGIVEDVVDIMLNIKAYPPPLSQRRASRSQPREKGCRHRYGGRYQAHR